METKLFLDSVLCAEGVYCLFASHSKLKKRNQRFFEDKQELIDYARELDSKGWDTFFALSSFQSSKSRKQDNVAKIRSFFLDLDCGPSKDFETQEQALIALRNFCKETGVETDHDKFAEACVLAFDGGERTRRLDVCSEKL